MAPPKRCDCLSRSARRGPSQTVSRFRCPLVHSRERYRWQSQRRPTHVADLVIVLYAKLRRKISGLTCESTSSSCKVTNVLPIGNSPSLGGKRSGVQSRYHDNLRARLEGSTTSVQKQFSVQESPRPGPNQRHAACRVKNRRARTAIHHLARTGVSGRLLKPLLA